MRNSFYGKARVIETAKKMHLQSYNTIVATWDKATKVLKIHASREFAPKRRYSQTTSRHIREFAKQRGLWLDRVNVGEYQA
jgi:hypothetical protein